MSDDPLDLDTGLPAGITADAAVLAPITLSIARRLQASADTDGVMRQDHQALARDLACDVAAIVAALEQLVRREHLIVVDTARAARRVYRGLRWRSSS